VELIGGELVDAIDAITEPSPSAAFLGVEIAVGVVNPTAR